MDKIKMPTLRSCARCRGDHFQIEFNPFTFPVTECEIIIGTHWALCPENGEPILLISEISHETN